MQPGSMMGRKPQIREDVDLGLAEIQRASAVGGEACRRLTLAAGREARLCNMGHATMENRPGLVLAGKLTPANGTAGRRASETMLKARRKASDVARPVTPSAALGPCYPAAADFS